MGCSLLNINNLKANVEDKEILKGIDLKISLYSTLAFKFFIFNKEHPIRSSP